MAQIVTAAFLVAHALIHLGFVSRRPTQAPGAPAWPFDLADGPLARRARLAPGQLAGVGRTLVLLVLAGYAIGALGALGLLPGTAFGAGVVIESVASLTLLVSGFHRWLVVGIVIDVLLIAVAAAGWMPR